MNYWEQREAELLAKENAWYDNLSPFMKAVDDPLLFSLGFLIANLTGFCIGTLIGFAL